MSCEALRKLYARWALRVYPIFEDEESTRSYKKLVKRKFEYKSPTGLTELHKLRLRAIKKTKNFRKPTKDGQNLLIFTTLPWSKDSKIKSIA